MNLKRVFSSQIMLQFFLYLTMGLIIVVGITIIVYEVMDIIKLQQGIGQFEQKLKHRVLTINNQLQSESKVEVDQEKGDKTEVQNSVLTLAQLEDATVVNPFQPRLEKKKEQNKQGQNNKEDINSTGGEKNKEQKIKNQFSLEKIKLVGLLINPRLKMAILKLSGGKNEIVYEGYQINNFVIKNINAEQVIIMPVIKDETDGIERLGQEFVLTMGGEDN